MSDVVNEDLPPGWHVDPDMGAWMRDVIHQMLRRCRNWDYLGLGVYLITLVLNDRSKPLLGRLAADRPEIVLTELGRAVERHFLRIPEFTPEIEVLGVQIMPEHLHGVLRVNRRLAKPLGEHLRGFKIGVTKIARGLGACSRVGGVCSGIDAGAQGVGRARGHGLFADGFVDTILGGEKAIAQGLAYTSGRLTRRRRRSESRRNSTRRRRRCWRGPRMGPCSSAPASVMVKGVEEYVRQITMRG